MMIPGNLYKIQVLILPLLLLFGCGRQEAPTRKGMDPVVKHLLQRGTQQLRQQDFIKALALADSAAQYSPQSSDVAMLRGRVYSEMGRFAKADSAYQQVLTWDPEYPGVWLNLGNNAYRASEYRQAIAYYRKELDKHPGPAPWRGMGRAYVELGAADSAKYVFEQAVKKDSSYAPVYHSLALLYEDEGEFGKALSYAKEALRWNPQNLGFEYQVGSLALSNGQEKEALRHLVRVIEEQSWHHGAHYNIGRALMRLGREDKAKEFMKKAEELRALDAEIKHLQNTVRSVPNDPFSHAALGSALRQAGRYNDAMHALKVASYLAPDNMDFRNNIANLHLIKKDTLRAIQEYKNILQRDSSQVNIWLNLGVVYALSERPKKARQAWQEVLQQEPGNQRAQTYLQRLNS